MCLKGTARGDVVGGREMSAPRGLILYIDE